MKKAFYALSVLFSVLLMTSCSNNDSNDVSSTEETQPVVEPKGGTKYDVSPGTSVVMWQGYKPGRTHTGTVEVNEGHLRVTDGMITQGYFSMDFTTLEVTDLETGDGKEKLEAHLKGTESGKETDFFNVSQYPSGSFEITKITALENDPEANHMVYGNLKLKGISKNVGFRAQVEMNNNTIIVTSPVFKINRTEWDLKFMSRNFFDNLGDNFIQDEIGLAINLVVAVGAG